MFVLTLCVQLDSVPKKQAKECVFNANKMKIATNHSNLVLKMNAFASRNFAKPSIPILNAHRKTLREDVLNV